MKQKTFLIIVSSMIFGMALLTGFAVITILLIGSQANSDSNLAVNIPDSSNIPTNNNLQNTANIMYLASRNNLLAVNLNDGSSQTLSLGLADSIDSGNFAFSDDGRLAAYCAMERIEHSVDNIEIKQIFYVRDLQTGSNLLEIPYGNIMACQAAGISPDASTVALSLVFNSPVENFVSNPDEPNWTLRFFDINSGAMVREMSADSAFAPDFAALSDSWFNAELPTRLRILHYGNDHIIFVAYPVFGGDGPIDVPAFRWEFASNSVIEIPDLGDYGADYLETTGELIFPMLDESLPYAEPLGPGPRANTLQITDSSGTRVIYRNTEWVVSQARFVNGGEKIAVVLFPDGDPNSPNPGAEGSRIEIIERDGTVHALENTYRGVSGIYPTSEGFVFQWMDFLSNPPTFYVERVVGTSATNIWTYTAGESNQWIHAVWASPMTAKSGFLPFAATS